jgi:peptide/nickel transport system permease protein
MTTYLVQRFASVVPVLLLVTAAVFALVHLTPGDAAVVIAGESADPETLARLRRDLGLDRPIYVQYGEWLGRVAQGNLGRSVRTNQPVVEAVGQRLKPTLQLSALALLLSLAVAIPVGVVSATRPGSPLDIGGTVMALFGVSMPGFLFALLMIFLFAVRLHWLPTSGYVDPFEDPVAGLRSLVLPALTLGTGLMAVTARMVRSSMLEVLGQDYIRTARAKGVRERAVVARHALRNALIPIVTVVGLQVGHLVGGAVITEYIFGIPGVGRLVVDAIFARDYPLTQGVVMLTACAFLAVNLGVDVLYAYLNPRIRYTS